MTEKSWYFIYILSKKDMNVGKSGFKPAKDNADGSKWETEWRYIYLCSEHFVTNMFDMNF